MFNCYNRGCGQTYDPEENKDDSCRHHPGVPFFHDAYKGWTCCNKKSTDFTEFLNIKGCTVSKHSNIKPPEPEKPQKQNDVDNEEIQVDQAPPAELRKPVTPSALVRPPLSTPLLKIVPDVVPGLKEAIDALKISAPAMSSESENVEIAVGTPCKNLACQTIYKSPETNYTNCQHHSGVPIFHEGMKYYSCCNKKTSDFTAFLNQAGCTSGSHKWTNDDKDKDIKCRYDFHQTASEVSVAIYAKMYHYESSFVKVNPIRLNVLLVFPDQKNAKFELDLELKGIIVPEMTKVKFYGTKVEIILAKAEAGGWSRLALPQAPVETIKQEEKAREQATTLSSEDDDDLDGIEMTKPQATLQSL